MGKFCIPISSCSLEVFGFCRKRCRLVVFVVGGLGKGKVNLEETVGFLFVEGLCSFEIDDWVKIKVELEIDDWENIEG